MDSRYDSFDRTLPASAVPLPTNLVGPSPLSERLNSPPPKTSPFSQLHRNSAHLTTPEPMTDPPAVRWRPIGRERSLGAGACR
ncbi:hypothetical protein CDAR_447571 [Caerostris darwini]|uniref:Uncharacterized protein n=1 Tax=Caerostris darwini TaxID=1538125 RepID=A0AAV4PNV9_9ARAC|nr:hypothetical protein CDAR_447571 [Caerostris darwini]